MAKKRKTKKAKNAWAATWKHEFGALVMDGEVVTGEAIGRDDQTHEERWENMLLISAAPELYRACCQLLDEIKKHDKKSVFPAAEAAIRKARGL